MPSTRDENYNESNFMRTAEREVNSLVKAARWSKLSIRALAVVAAVLVAVACVLGVVISSQGGIIGDVRSGAVTSCQDGNKYRAQQTQIWESFYASQAAEAKATGKLLASLVQIVGDNDPGKISQINAILADSGKISAAQEKLFLSDVARVNAPRNCSKVYQLNLPASNAPSPSPGSGH